MKCEWIPNPGNPPEYRKLLAEGVEGIECLYAGPWAAYEDVHDHVRKLILTTAPPGHYLVTVEAYADGSLNVFVRKDINEPAVGFVRYRPDG